MALYDDVVVTSPGGIMVRYHSMISGGAGVGDVASATGVLGVAGSNVA